MDKYVLGFLFKKSAEVLLIKKINPPWQKGKLNGIGGHVESGEEPLDAMRREFTEEAGFPVEEWEEYCILYGNDFQIFIFYAHFIEDLPLISPTPEKISWENIGSLPENVIPNLRWLIPMAFSFQLGENCQSFLVEQL